MSTVGIYLVEMLKCIAVAALVASIFRFVYNKIKKNTINYYHEAGIIILFSWIAGVASLTLGSNAALTSASNDLPQVYMVPFVFIIDYIKRVKYFGFTDFGFFIDLIGNIIVFMPIGFLLPLVWRIKNKNVIITGLSMSLFIEIFQLFNERITDINDVILNTLGTAIGLGLYILLNKKHKNISKKFKAAR